MSDVALVPVNLQSLFDSESVSAALKPWLFFYNSVTTGTPRPLIVLRRRVGYATQFPSRLVCMYRNKCDRETKPEKDFKFTNMQAPPRHTHLYI